MKYSNLFFISFLFLLTTSINAQSIKEVANKVTVEYDSEDFEKAVKASAQLIPSKKGHVWNVNNNQWSTTFINNIYSLKKGGIEIYTSTTITAIRAKYLSDLLGIPMKSVL